jgi:hypothetical protein
VWLSAASVEWSSWQQEDRMAISIVAEDWLAALVRKVDSRVAGSTGSRHLSEEQMKAGWQHCGCQSVAVWLSAATVDWSSWQPEDRTAISWLL